MAPTTHAPDEILLAFARALRAAGLPVTADRARTFLDAGSVVGLTDQFGVYAAGRATLCSSPQDLERYDQVYAAWFSGEATFPSAVRSQPPTRAVAGLGEECGGGPGEDDADAVTMAASATEVLRHRDIAELSPGDRDRLNRLFAALRPHPPLKVSRRRRPSPHGIVDGRATLRDQLRRMGEPGRIRRHDKSVRPRRLVLLIDVSGSMSGYADALLRLAHRFSRGAGQVEVFTIGTRLTHVTRALRQPDPERALVAAGMAVPDWSGGTRLGEGLAAFLDLWGRRGMARGAVVVVFSDGWERQGPDVLAEQMRRLRSLAHRVIWVNPHRGKSGYEPIQSGMVAALPHVDAFLSGHSMAAFEDLAEMVARA